MVKKGSRNRSLLSFFDMHTFSSEQLFASLQQMLIVQYICNKPTRFFHYYTKKSPIPSKVVTVKVVLHCATTIKIIARQLQVLYY